MEHALVHPKPAFARLFLILTAGVSIYTLIAAGLLYYYNVQSRNTVKNQAVATFQTAENTINSHLALLQNTVETIAQNLSSCRISEHEIERLLEDKPSSLLGLGIFFSPLSNQKKHTIPYLTTLKGEQTLLSLNEKLSTAQLQEWITLTQASVHALSKAWYDPLSKSMVIQYTAPFFDAKEHPCGFVFGTYSLSALQHTLRMDIPGYWFLASQSTGTFIAHPSEQLVKKQVTLKKLGIIHQNTALHDAHQATTRHVPFQTTYNNELTGTTSWLFTAPISQANLILGGVFEHHFWKNEAEKKYACALIFALLFLLTILSLVGYILFSRAHTHGSLWILSAIVSIALVAQIGMIWHARITYAKPELKTPLTSQQVLQEVLTREHSTIPSERAIPTGIYLTNISVVNAEEIKIVGYIWQHYYKGMHDTVTRGFVLPQITNAAQRRIEEIYRRTSGNRETVLWHIDTLISQDFDFRTYPFDTKNIEITFWHPDLDKEILLIPDFAAYPSLYPESLAGIVPYLRIPNWELFESFFSYDSYEYRSNFGMYKIKSGNVYKIIDKSQQQELQFTISIQRRLLDTLVTDLLPMFVIALLLFIVLLTIVQQEWQFLGVCSTLFFGVVVAHMQFRSKTAGYDLVYFENFYFLLHAAIFLVSIATFCYWIGIPLKILRFKEGLILKLLYWPLLLLGVVIISYAYLY